MSKAYDISFRAEVKSETQEAEEDTVYTNLIQEYLVAGALRVRP